MERSAPLRSSKEVEMKCVCGYEYETEWIGKSLEIVAGDEPFIAIDTKATVCGNDYYRTQRDIDLYICPKCNTVLARR